MTHQARSNERKAARWQRVGALFDRALSSPAARRAAIVRDSGEPSDIQDEVRALLMAHDESDGFLEPPSLLEPGAQVGAYRIERVLGRGGMGIVYLAHDARLNRAVALKALPPHLFSDERMRARLRREARAAASLSHPGIATVYALEEIDEAVYIASEYLDGRTLRDELRGGPFSESRALDIARAIAGALQAAHDRGIVHRDLKPENIILATGGVKLVDFGIAHVDGGGESGSGARLTDAGTIAGTPPYMAPEQRLGHASSPRTDQYAFGVVLHEMLGHASGPLGSVIARAMHTDPLNRFPSMRDLVQALDEAAAPGTLGTLGTLGTGTLGTLNWWTLHQLVVALSYWFMVWPAWAVHKWTGRYGVLTFLATLAVVVVGANTRLHLWFTARTYPSELTAQRARIRLLVGAADVAFSLLMLATGLVIAGEHTGWGALFVSFGLGAAVAFLVIEPATARAAFKSALRNPKSEIV